MKNTKTKLISSVTVLLICFAMLIGSTFAWFTDSASTDVNKIKAGTLKIGLEMKDPTYLPYGWKNAVGESLSWQKLGASEGDEVIWEPGATYQLPTLKITNNGNLALQFQILISSISGDMDLLNALEFKCTYASVVEEWTSEPVTIQGSEIVNLPYELPRDPRGATEEQMEEFGIKGNVLPNKEYDPDMEGVNVAYYTIEAHMKEDAGNQYQGLSLNDIAVTVVATQVASFEYDSFNNTYDKDAEYALPVSTEDEFASALASGNDIILNSEIQMPDVIEIKNDVTIYGS